MSPNALLCALLLLALPAVPPSADAATAPRDPIDPHADVCLLGSRTLERDLERTPADALHAFLAPCFDHGATAPVVADAPDGAPGVGVVLSDDGDHNEVRVTHGYLLGGAVVVAVYDERVRVAWTHGITNCWIDMPSTEGATCAY